MLLSQIISKMAIIKFTTRLGSASGFLTLLEGANVEKG